MTDILRAVPPGSLVRRFAAEEAAKIKGITVDLVLSVDRRAAVAWARTRLTKRLRARGYSLSGIGMALGVDHSTVFHHLKRELRDEPPVLTARQPPKHKREQPKVRFSPPRSRSAAVAPSAIAGPPLARLMAGR